VFLTIGTVFSDLLEDVAVVLIIVSEGELGGSWMSETAVELS
jgi:hypothetical protein